MISDGENSFVQNTCNKFMKYRNVPPKHKNAIKGSSAIHLHAWCRHDRYSISKLTIKHICVGYVTPKYVIIFSLNIRMFI